MRINKFIATNSEYSRRKADELIEQGLVKINGKKVTNLGIDIDPENDQVTVQNKLINSKSEKIYIALNKPKNFITTRNDEFDRETVMSLVPKHLNLKPVGRLDKDSEGLLLMSNDGEFINKMTHPSNVCEKEYIVKINGSLSKEDLEKLENGINLEGKKTAPAEIIIEEIKNDKTRLRITIHEGRNRQIRKMFAQLNYPVKYLQRIRIGTVRIGSLKQGTFRHLTKSEIQCSLAS